MVYKMISEWWSEDKRVHELTVYKYNLSHDEVMRYNYELGTKYVTFTSQCFGMFTIQEGKFEVVKYRMLKDANEIAMSKLGEGNRFLEGE